MENVKTKSNEITSFSFYRKIVLSVLKRFEKGRLELTLPEGEKMFIGQGDGYTVDLHIHNENFFKKFVLYSDVGFGESYVDGDWDTTNLTNLVKWAIDNVETSGVMSGSKTKEFSVNLLDQINKFTHLFNRNSKEGSQKNISYHYDLSNDFYELMLDSTMSYSCGIFENESTTLHESQIAKLDKICTDLDLKETDTVLEIGCGWGGLAIHAVSKYGCKWKGVTISKEQLAFAKDKVKSLGLEDKIELVMMDYRDMEGQFDKIVSIEMIEAVGHEFLPQYFEKIDSLLKPQGAVMIQAITSPDSRYDSFRKGVDFIQKHIFPGSLLPSVAAMVGACKKTNLQLINLRDIGTDYARTLNLWEQNVEKYKKEIEGLGMDTTFFRKWKYYLNYCEAAFATRNISDVQITLVKANNTEYKMS